MSDINKQHVYEDYTWSHSIELSKYRTMDDLVEILDEYYRIIENIHALHTDNFTSIEDSYQFYKNQLKRDSAKISSGKNIVAELLETQREIESKLDYFLALYYETEPKLTWRANMLNDKEDRIHYHQQNDKFFILFQKIYTNIEDIFEQYNTLIEWQWYENNE